MATESVLKREEYLKQVQAHVAWAVDEVMVSYFLLIVDRLHSTPNLTLAMSTEAVLARERRDRVEWAEL